ncbi:DUF3035 domain-containing protein [Rhizorhabdus dicambivorans]|uniref:DUF3035 domain-containing protein n=1 Tax=Rhizorhabdus dicambivorans TaxID=1850238 RepID=A0A2A4FVF5_9SPHN|nr:DUF3035 domain-containing protein [Rhizorhabdus dicambivorans]ATE66948.1 DUF3035 domain-containing protein [Rhizorhabdus dicambivorans]PCE42179.1 DUF3035 domain-containing protein [Rhizorhabdus dicambivorans]
MRSKLLLGSALVAMTLLSACSRGDRAGVMAGRSSSLDAFAVSKRAPLTIPPDFALTPPRPGAPRPQEADSSQQALSAMFANTQPPRSQTEKDIIGLTRTLPEPGIRSTVGEVSVSTVNKGPATRTILAAAATDSADASVTLGN